MRYTDTWATGAQPAGRETPRVTPTETALLGAGVDIEQEVARRRPKASIPSRLWSGLERVANFIPRMEAQIVSPEIPFSPRAAWRGEGPTLGEETWQEFMRAREVPQNWLTRAYLAPLATAYKKAPRLTQMAWTAGTDIAFDPTTYLGMGAIKAGAKGATIAPRIAREALAAAPEVVGQGGRRLIPGIVKRVLKTGEVPVEAIKRRSATIAERDYLVGLGEKLQGVREALPKTALTWGIGKHKVTLASPERLRQARNLLTEPYRAAVEKHRILAAPAEMLSPAFIRARTMAEAPIRRISQMATRFRRGHEAEVSSAERYIDAIKGKYRLKDEDAILATAVHWRVNASPAMVADDAAKIAKMEPGTSEHALASAIQAEHERLISQTAEQLVSHLPQARRQKVLDVAEKVLPETYDAIWKEWALPREIEKATRRWGKYKAALEGAATETEREAILAKAEARFTGIQGGLPKRMWEAPAPLETVPGMAPIPIQLPLRGPKAAVSALQEPTRATLRNIPKATGEWEKSGSSGFVETLLKAEAKKRGLTVGPTLSKDLPVVERGGYQWLARPILDFEENQVGSVLTRKVGDKWHLRAIWPVEKPLPIRQVSGLPATMPERAPLGPLPGKAGIIPVTAPKALAAITEAPKAIQPTTEQAARILGLPYGKALPEIEKMAKWQVEKVRPGWRPAYLPGVSAEITEAAGRMGSRLGNKTGFFEYAKTFQHPFDRSVAADAMLNMGRNELRAAKTADEVNEARAMIELGKKWKPEENILKAMHRRIVQQTLTQARGKLFAEIKRAGWAVPSEKALHLPGWEKAPWEEMKGFHVPSEVVEGISKVYQGPAAKIVSPVLQDLFDVSDKVLAWTKGQYTANFLTGSRWITLNTVGNTYFMWLQGVPMWQIPQRVAQGRGLQLLKPMPEGLGAVAKRLGFAGKLPKGAEMVFNFPNAGGRATARRVTEELSKRGVFSGFPVGELPIAARPQGWKKLVMPSQFWRNVNENIEESYRAGLAIHALEKGATWDEAADLVNRAFIEYTNLTSSEKAFKKLIPFYTWLSRNFRINLEMALKQPGKILAVEKARHALGTTFPQYPPGATPKWLQEQQAFRIGTGKKGPLYMLSRLPLSEMGGYLDIRQMPGKLRPGLQIPMTVAYGKNPVTGQPMKWQQAVREALPVIGTGGRIISAQPGRRLETAVGAVAGYRHYEADAAKELARREEERRQVLYAKARQLRARDLIPESKAALTRRKKIELNAQRQIEAYRRGLGF